MGKCALFRGSVAIAGLLCLGLDWPSLQEWRYDRAQIRKEKLHYTLYTAAAIQRGKPRYDAVARRTGVPWYVIGAIHNMECGLSFQQNLAQGDSIYYKSRHVPKGRPPGNPPFTWEYCAEDALRYDGMGAKNWSRMGFTLNNIELYNGPGYQKWHPDVPSPYLWAGTTIYTRGKYIEDGRWSSTAVSQQLGVAPVFKALNLRSGK